MTENAAPQPSDSAASSPPRQVGGGRSRSGDAAPGLAVLTADTGLVEAVTHLASSAVRPEAVSAVAVAREVLTA